MPRFMPFALTLTGLLATPALMAGGPTVTFQYIPQANTARDMSPDGRFIVGAADQDENGFPDGTYIFDRQTGTTTILPSIGLDATAVSDDGTVVLGCMPDPADGSEVAGIWTAAKGWQSLGFLPDALMCPSRSNGYELSADGTVAVGLSWDGCSGRGFRWTEATGMVELEPMANGGNRASVVSADGNVIGGFAQGSFSRTPVRWDGTTSAGMLLDPPNGDVVGEVQGISDDGNVLLGNWAGDAFTWTESDGMQVIGEGSVIGTWTGIATDIADDGTIVGFDTFFQSRQAWIAIDNVITTLASYVTNGGGKLPGGTSLGVATRISADSRTIVGHTFFDQAWMITVAPGCPADIDGGGAVDFNDLLTLLSNWGTDGAGADIAEPTDIVDFNDLLVMLSSWGACP